MLQRQSGRKQRPLLERLSADLRVLAIHRQHVETGAFVVDGLQPQRYSFLTACALEGIASALGLAERVGDARRFDRYRSAWQTGVRFLERLVIHDSEAFFSSDPARAVGGVRGTLTSSHLHVDFAAHALLALGKGLRATSTRHGLASQGRGWSLTASS